MSAIVHLMSPFTPEGETRDRVYQFVRELLEEGQPPTLREVQQAFGFRAVETARKHLERLVEEGRLEKNPGEARGYRLPKRRGGGKRFATTKRVPILGRVPAGDPLEAIEYSEDSVLVDVSTYGNVSKQFRSKAQENLFALRIEGESMIGVGILPGDIVIIRAQETAQSGDIVVARVDGEATVKTLQRRGRRVELQPENPEYETILVPSKSEFSILGKIIEVRRVL